MVEEYIQREAPDIEARKLGLMDSAKALTEQGYEIPEYILAGLTEDQKNAFALARQGIGSFKPFLQQAEQATAQAITKAINSEPNIDWLLENQDKIVHKYYQMGLDGKL